MLLLSEYELNSTPEPRMCDTFSSICLSQTHVSQNVQRIVYSIEKVALEVDEYCCLSEVYKNNFSQPSDRNQKLTSEYDF